MLDPRTPSFVVKLYDIVQQGPEDLVRWSPDGARIQVATAKRFEQEVLAAHFKSSNFGSFVRQLNFYSFSKSACTVAGFQIEFHHYKFHRDKPELMVDIRRRTCDHSERKEAAMLRMENAQLKCEISRLRRELSLIWESVETAALASSKTARAAADVAGVTPGLGHVVNSWDPFKLDLLDSVPAPDWLPTDAFPAMPPLQPATESCDTTDPGSAQSLLEATPMLVPASPESPADRVCAMPDSCLVAPPAAVLGPRTRRSRRRPPHAVLSV